MLAMGGRVKLPGVFARAVRRFYDLAVKQLIESARALRLRELVVAAAVAAGLMMSTNRSAMGEPAGAEPQLTRAQVTIEASASSSGATLVIGAKPADSAAMAALGEYGKLLAERLARGEMGPLFRLVPAAPEVARMLEENPVAFIVTPHEQAIRVELIASGQASRAAIHQYVATELTERAKRATNHPGNNLGWGAPRDPNASN
jgi:hypothetical protein